MRVSGIVLVALGALTAVPALAYAAYLRLGDPWFADPAGLKTHLALIAAGLGACVAGIGAAAVLVSGRDGPPSR